MRKRMDVTGNTRMCEECGFESHSAIFCPRDGQELKPTEEMQSLTVLALRKGFNRPSVKPCSLMGLDGKHLALEDVDEITVTPTLKTIICSCSECGYIFSEMLIGDWQSKTVLGPLFKELEVEPPAKEKGES